MEAEKVNIKFKHGIGKEYDVEVPVGIKVSKLKQLLEERSKVPAGSQRLVYAGQILKDDSIIESLGIKDGHVVHLVGTPVETEPPMQPTGDGQAQQVPPSQAGDPFTASVQQMMSNPEVFREIMNSPMTKSMFENPELLEQILLNNPHTRRMIEGNPEIGHALRDPQYLKMISEMMQNPAMMEEAQRSADMAMRNVESLPGGFNALSRIYQDVSGPLDEAAESMSQPRGDISDPNPSINNERPSTEPFSFTEEDDTNGWEGSSGGAGSAGGMGGLGGLDLGGMGDMFDPQAIENVMGNPMYQNMMRSMLQNPQMMQQMLESNPFTAGMMQSNPGFRNMLSNPEYLQSVQNMMEGMFTSSSGSGGAQPGPGNAQAPLGQMPGTAGSGTAQPERSYESELEKLELMGFTNREDNLRALRAASGNVEMAVDILLR